MKLYVVYILLLNIIIIVSGSPSKSSRIIKATQAMCMPDLQIVPVKVNPDPSSTYFPNCVRIKRCGGCCNHPLLSCQPTQIDTRNYEIQVLELGNDFRPIRNFKEIVQLEEHIACKCDCKLNETDCTEKQYYSQDCRCSCKNSDELNKCQQQDEKKYWDPKNCSCHCRKIEECGRDSYFDTNSCSCESLYDS